MPLHSSQRQESAVATAVMMKVVADQEPTKASEPYRLHAVAASIQYTTPKKSYNTYRRYTIDDNGGSYEGL